MLLGGERKISWPMAERLSKMFPGKSISEWKRSEPSDLKQVFNQLKVEA
jgi:plasmid maintenance system antidote protein VapI